MVKSEHWSNEYFASPIIHPPMVMDPSTKLAFFGSESSSSHFAGNTIFAIFLSFI